MEDLWSSKRSKPAARDDAAGPLVWISGVELALRAQLERERVRWFLWAPVLVASGIAIYFQLPEEPSVWAVIILVYLATAFYLASRRPAASLLCIGTALVLSGLIVAKVRTITGGPGNLILPLGVVQVEGWLEQVQMKPNGKGWRFTVVPKKIEGVAAAKLPERIQLSWRGKKRPRTRSGDYVKTKVRFLDPLEPVWPGGYDPGFSRWYQGIGASGILFRSPEQLKKQPVQPIRLAWRAQIEQIRAAITQRLRSALPGTSGAVAAALITGDRAAIPAEDRDNLRGAGLAHLLAISGLHMALFAGGAFWLIRAILALNPLLATSRPIKKWAAVLALMSAAGYLLISGSGLATQRAFLMISIMFIAILCDRPALSMRNVAIAALLIFVFRPENLMSVSFQLSFMAVIALVALFEWLDDWRTARGPVEFGDGPVVRFFRRTFDYFFRIGTTTLMAGLATAPIAAFHFNRMAAFSLLGNLLAIPLVGSIVMPAAIIALIMMPFGLEHWPLALMGQGIEYVLQIAKQVTALPGAVRHIPLMPDSAGLLIALGLLWMFLWRQKWRVAGLAIIGLGIGIGQFASFPDVLVAANGKQVGLQRADGKLAFSSKRAGRYVAERWLLKFGDSASFKDATTRKGFRCDRHGCTGHLKSGAEVVIVKHPAILAEECKRAVIVIITFIYRGSCPSALKLITTKILQHRGVHALYVQPGAPLVLETRTARTRRGDRPWTAAPERIKRKRRPATPEPKGIPQPKDKKPPGKAPVKDPPLQVRI